MKFTLLSNDKVKFKIKQKWEWTMPETIVDGSYCCDCIKHLVSALNYYNPTHPVKFNNILNLEIRKNKEIINYDIEAWQLYLLPQQGQGEYFKVASIDVEIDEVTDKAKIQINIERVSLAKKALSLISHKINSILK